MCSFLLLRLIITIQHLEWKRPFPVAVSKLCNKHCEVLIYFKNKNMPDSCLACLYSVCHLILNLHNRVKTPDGVVILLFRRRQNYFMTAFWYFKAKKMNNKTTVNDPSQFNFFVFLYKPPKISQEMHLFLRDLSWHKQCTILMKLQYI